MSSSVIHLFLLLSLFTAQTTLSAATINIPLSISSGHPSSGASPWESIGLLATSSLARARHLKRRPAAVEGKSPLNPRSYGGYSVTFSFGTPPQQVSMVMDTGSSLVWTPCSTARAAYSCLNCTFSGVHPDTIPTFKYNNSSTARPVSCRSRTCGWVFGSGFNCSSSRRRQLCPSYSIQYGLGSTIGNLISDTVRLSKTANPVKNFFFGCSVLSDQQPEGIAGFGRGSASLPAQLKLTKFSYCMVSHKFDDTPRAGVLVLNGGGAGGTTAGVTYTPFIKNPPVSPYLEYYYLALERITVGGKNTPIPAKYLAPSARGEGGVIVDSGSTFTFMERAIHGPVASEFVRQMGRYKRIQKIEEATGLGPCYNVTGLRGVVVPTLTLVFKGGARMNLPSANYFSYVGGPTVVCMTVLTDTLGRAGGQEVPSGPAVILGNYQQQNFHVEYDLVKQRFGFKPQQCGAGGN